MDIPQLEHVHVAYHRNGISGHGFHVVTFVYNESGTAHHMLATVFQDKGACAVLDIDACVLDNITFADGNSWRGDYFEPALRQHIASYEQNPL